MKKFPFLIILLLFFIISCAHSKKNIAQYVKDISSFDKLLQESKELSIKAFLTRSNPKRKKLAAEGIIYSSRCIELDPQNAPCRYYRAVNTGLYYQAKVVGYQKGLKEMIEDCKIVIQEDPSYENGGAYLIFGQIYSQVPITAARPGDIIRDLELAEKNLKEAVAIVPLYPENHLYLAKVQLELGLDAEAAQSLKRGKELMKDNVDSIYYNDWKKLANSVEKGLKGIK